MSAGLNPVLDGRRVCRFNSGPGGPASAGLTPVMEGRSVCRFNSCPGGLDVGM